jgi:predicted  nucleic acid-binding Zn-ribbon protein
LNDIKKNFHFTIENLGDISPLIESIQKSLRSMNKESERLNDEFLTLKNELLK